MDGLPRTPRRGRFCPVLSYNRLNMDAEIRENLRQTAALLAQNAKDSAEWREQHKKEMAEHRAEDRERWAMQDKWQAEMKDKIKDFFAKDFFARHKSTGYEVVNEKVQVF